VLTHSGGKPVFVDFCFFLEIAGIDFELLLFVNCLPLFLITGYFLIGAFIRCFFYDQ